MKKLQTYPSPLMSILPIVLLVVLLFFTIKSFGSDALSGASQVCLLITTAVCSAIGMLGYGIKWKDIEHAIVNNIAGVSSAIIILLIALFSIIFKTPAPIQPNITNRHIILLSLPDILFSSGSFIDCAYKSVYR